MYVESYLKRPQDFKYKMKLFEDYQISEELKRRFRMTQFIALRTFSVSELREWPSDLINSFMDDAITAGYLNYNLSAYFWGVIKFAQVTDDADLKKRIKDRIATFTAAQQQQLKLNIFERML